MMTWLKLIPYIAIAVLVAAVGVLGWRLEANLEKVGAAREALEQAKRDNEEWTASEKRHEKFVAEVRDGFNAMQQKLDATRQTNQTFQQQVRSNVRSNDALTADERAALGLWRADPTNPPGAGQGGNPSAPPRVR